MGFNSSVQDAAVGNGGAGSPEVWDIITSTAHDLGDRIVTAFMSLDDDGGTMGAMSEQITPPSGHVEGVVAAVAAKYLTYTYPLNIPFEGRYTLLTPQQGCTFKVWFLKQG